MLAGSFWTAGATSAQRLVVTPMVGQRFGGEIETRQGDDPDVDASSAHGVIISIPLDEESWIEILASRQSTRLESRTRLFTSEPLFDLDVEYLHVGGLYQWENNRAWPFISGSIGLTHLDPGPPELDSETRFSASFGAGVRIIATRWLSFRLEGRGFGTFIDTGSTIFCSAGGGASCLVEVEGDLLLQGELSVGASFSF